MTQSIRIRSFAALLVFLYLYWKRLARYNRVNAGGRAEARRSCLSGSSPVSAARGWQGAPEASPSLLPSFYPPPPHRPASSLSPPRRARPGSSSGSCGRWQQRRRCFPSAPSPREPRGERPAARAARTRHVPAPARPRVASSRL